MDGGMLGTIWAGLGGLAATAVTGWVATHLRKVDPTMRGEHDFDKSAKGVKFLMDWMAVRKQVSGSNVREDQQIEELLNDMLHRYTKAWHEHKGYENPAEVGFFRRFLLFFLPVKPFGWAYRAVFYMVVAMLGFMALVVASPGEGQTAGSLFGGFVIASIPFVLFLLFVRWRAVKHDLAAFAEWQASNLEDDKDAST